MSVVLLIKDHSDAQDRSIPVATQAHYVTQWVRGATDLALTWLPLAETGFDVTADNRDTVLSELAQLREWFESRADHHSIGRLDRLVQELKALRFEEGASAFFG